MLLAGILSSHPVLKGTLSTSVGAGIGILLFKKANDFIFVRSGYCLSPGVTLVTIPVAVTMVLLIGSIPLLLLILNVKIKLHLVGSS